MSNKRDKSDKFIIGEEVNIPRYQGFGRDKGWLVSKVHTRANGTYWYEVRHNDGGLANATHDELEIPPEVIARREREAQWMPIAELSKLTGYHVRAFRVAHHLGVGVCAGIITKRDGRLGVWRADFEAWKRNRGTTPTSNLSAQVKLRRKLEAALREWVSAQESRDHAAEILGFSKTQMAALMSHRHSIHAVGRLLDAWEVIGGQWDVTLWRSDEKP